MSSTVKETKEAEDEVIDETTGAEDKKDEKWSKEKQRADQIEASFRKVSAERDEILSQLAARDDEIASLKSKMEEIAEAQDVSVEELLDPDLVDAKTIKAVSKMAKQIREQEASIKKLSKLADGFQLKEKQNTIQAEKEKTIEKILKPLDDEFGAKFRNPARKLADKLVDEGSEKQPQDVIEAMTYMRKCYIAVKDEAEKKEKEKEKKPVRTDSGSSSVSYDDSLPKAGSRKEILAEIRKKGLNLFGKAQQI